MHRAHRIIALASLAIWAPAICRLEAAITVNLTPSVPQPRPVGTTITWTVAASDTSPGTLDYRFSVRPPGGIFRVVRDFDILTTFDWRPADREGAYEFRVAARNRTTKAIAAINVMYAISARATNVPVVSATTHPLVALYSAPPCPSGSQMRVRFGRPSDTIWQSTPFKPCTPGFTMNFYVAGMYASTQYSMRHDIQSGPRISSGPILSFTTGRAAQGFPATTVLNPADPPTSLSHPIILQSDGAALDLAGRLVWYQPDGDYTIYRPVSGGTFLAAGESRVREIDLVGSVLRETTAARVSEQLVAMGRRRINSIHHEATRLPNGFTAVLGSTEQIMNDVQGPGPVDIIGDAIIVLDQNFVVSWVWDAFDHVDVRRKAVLGEDCDNPAGGGGCPPYHLAPVANDWLHSNAIDYTPDGHFLVSMRHQDWVIKVNYANGTGNGNVIWRLGKDGDFTINSTDPSPWFSHQHDAEYELNGTQILTIYDNGNTRRETNPNAMSRGQQYRLNDANRTATLEVNADLGVYSRSVGSIQRLSNGNVYSHSGNTEPLGFSRATESTPNGMIVSNLETQDGVYRSFRMRSMYLQ